MSLRKLAVTVIAWILVSLTLLAAPAASYSQGTAQANQDNDPVQIVRINTENHPQIEIVVGALGPTGKPLIGLTANDFTVYEDGKQVLLQSAVFITDANIPLVSVLVIDTS